MEIYIPTTDQEFSQRKIEEYAKFEKIINWGRKDPVHFAEEFSELSSLIIKMVFYGVLGQTICFMAMFQRYW